MCYHKKILEDLKQCQKDLIEAQNATKNLAKNIDQLKNQYNLIIPENLKLHVKITQLEDKLQEEFVEAPESIQPAESQLRPPNKSSDSNIHPKPTASNANVDDSNNIHLGIFVTKFDP